MLYLRVLYMPYFWLAIWILHSIAYYGILQKMGLKPIHACIPFVAEKKIGNAMFQTSISFWYPFILAVLFFAAAMYYNPFGRVPNISAAFGKVFLFFSFVNYYGYLSRLYWRLGKSFGRGIFFRIGMFLLPFVFLIVLGHSRLPFLHGTPIRLYKWRPKKWFRWFLGAGSVLGFAGEVAVIALGIAFVIMRTSLPRPIIQALQDDTYNKTKGIVSDHSEVLREENMGDSYSRFQSIRPSRDLYFADKSKNESVVVMEYVIGSDLETRAGSASTNFRQFFDATKQGSNLTFVVEAGGAYRWFTNGIADNSVGRYTIRDGKMEKVQELDSYLSMSSASELEAFIKWAKENYPADRYMLVLWDHGGGLGTGYGVDDLNQRDMNENPVRAINTDEIISAIRNAGVKFDMIGFDACLMQNIEIALAMEPYADYFVASEESEPGGGWFYTSAFGMLAKDPTVPTEDFGRELIGTYDQYNKAQSDKEQTEYTLSLVDLRYVKPAYDKLCELLASHKDAINRSEADYVDISLAVNSAYTFMNDEQVDLVDYLENLKETDLDSTVANEPDIDEVIAYAKACVTARNRRCADGVNGIAFTFPYQALANYKYDWKQLKSLNLKDQESFFNDFFSIMAASRSGELIDNTLLGQLLGPQDYTKEEWYVTGFEDYVTTVPMIDVPVVPNGDAYSLELSDKVWKLIVDSKQFYYMETENGLQYLGMDDVGRLDENGHPMVTTDGTWISLDGQPIFYEPSGSRDADGTTIFTGITKARLNNQTDIILYIEWDPMTENSDGPEKGTIIGYDPVDEDSAFMQKGMKELEPGETLDFLFDFYDEEGKLIETRTSGKTYRVVKPESIIVQDAPLKSCTLKHGVLLTDAYQRKYQSAMVETTIE